MALDKDRARQNARRRGASFEQRVADLLGGRKWSGEDGDVEARGYRFECKYRTNLQLESTRTLRDWFEQLNGYRKQWADEKLCALAFTGGAQSGGEIWVAIPIADFDRLTAADEDRRLVADLVAKYGDGTDLYRKFTEALVLELSSRPPVDDYDWTDDDNADSD